MPRLAIALVLALATTAASAQNSGSEQSQKSPTVAGKDRTQTFLFRCPIAR